MRRLSLRPQEHDFAAHELIGAAVEERNASVGGWRDARREHRLVPGLVRRFPNLLEEDLFLRRVPHGPGGDDGNPGEGRGGVLEEDRLKLFILRPQLHRLLEVRPRLERRPEGGFRHDRIREIRRGEGFAALRHEGLQRVVLPDRGGGVLLRDFQLLAEPLDVLFAAAHRLLREIRCERCPTAVEALQRDDARAAEGVVDGELCLWFSGFWFLVSGIVGEPGAEIEEDLREFRGQEPRPGVAHGLLYVAHRVGVDILRRDGPPDPQALLPRDDRELAAVRSLEELRVMQHDRQGGLAAAPDVTAGDALVLELVLAAAVEVLDFARVEANGPKAEDHLAPLPLDALREEIGDVLEGERRRHALLREDDGAPEEVQKCLIERSGALEEQGLAVHLLAELPPRHGCRELRGGDVRLVAEEGCVGWHRRQRIAMAQSDVMPVSAMASLRQGA